MQGRGVGYLKLQGMPIYLFIAIVIIYKNKMCFPICILATISSDGWCLSFANFPKGSSVRLCCFGHSNSGLWQQWLLARIINHNSNFSQLHFTRPYQFLESQWNGNRYIYLVPYSWVIEPRPNMKGFTPHEDWRKLPFMTQTPYSMGHRWLKCLS